MTAHQGASVKIESVSMEDTLPHIVSVGSQLREAREAKGLDIEKVAEALRIGRRHLRNLEDEDSVLDQQVYTFGFLRSYATYLGLDAGALVKRLKETSAQQSVVHHDFSFPTPVPQKSLPQWKSLALSFLALLFLLGGGLWYWGESTSSVVPAKRADQTVVTPDVTPLTLLSIKLKASDNVWMEIQDAAGGIVLQKTLQPSEEYELPLGENFSMTVGNAGGLQLVIDGKSVGTFGKAGEVKRYIPLNQEKLLADYIQKQ